MTDSKRLLVRFFGYAITALSFYYLASVLLRYDLSGLKLPNPSLAAAYGILLTLGYALLIPVVAFAWRVMLEFVSSRRISAREALGVYIKSSIAKYLPGNVMHVAGRNYLGSRLGWRHADIAMASFLEIVLTLATCGVIVIPLLLGGVLTMPEGLSVSLKNKAQWIVPAAAVAGVVIFCMYARTGLQDLLKRFPIAQALSMVARVSALYAFVFLSVGAVLASIYPLVLGISVTMNDGMRIVGVFVLSWALGLVVPGAPGGLGVRESAIVMLLSPSYGGPNSLLAALILRIITVLGDVVAFVASYVLLGSRLPPKRPGGDDVPAP